MPGAEHWKKGNAPIGAHRSQTTASIAPVDATRAVLVHRGATSNQLYAHLYDSRQELRWTLGGALKGLTKSLPVAVVAHGRVHVFHLGDSSDSIWWARSPRVDSTPTWWHRDWTETQTSLSSAVSPAVIFDETTDRIVLIGAEKYTGMWVG